jgi:hypothetical protein
MFPLGNIPSQPALLKRFVRDQRRMGMIVRAALLLYGVVFGANVVWYQRPSRLRQSALPPSTQAPLVAWSPFSPALFLVSFTFPLSK